jgi:hypothetical protein
MLDSRTMVDSLENADTSGAFAKFGSGPTQRLSFGPPNSTWTPPGPAARAESAALARERHELLGLAGVALDPQKAVLEQAAPEIGLELGVNVGRQRTPLGRPPVPEPGIVLGHQLVEQRRRGPVSRVSRRGNEILRLRDVAARRTHAMRPCTVLTAMSVGLRLSPGLLSISRKIAVTRARGG